MKPFIWAVVAAAAVGGTWEATGMGHVTPKNMSRNGLALVWGSMGAAAVIAYVVAS